MSVPVLNTGMRALTVTAIAVSPTVPVPGMVALTGALLSADNRDWTTTGSDGTRLNALLKRGYATVSTAHVRNAREADAAVN